MNTPESSHRLQLEPESPQRLANLCGRLNEHIHQIEERLQVKIRNRGSTFEIIGQQAAVDNACSILEDLYQQTAANPDLGPDNIHLAIQEDRMQAEDSNDSAEQDFPLHVLKTPKGSIKPRNRHQNAYVHAVLENDINFGIGPAGTGKTYLAVACAVEALTNDQVSRILLVRPAVEAGEKLGFLPGDLAQKVDPYLRPLYDALYEMLGFERVARLIEKNIIEVAPLAYMRGRTLNSSFIILDESQNTTMSQMKMFLTRIGFGSTAVITGDITQIDLPKGVRSGLVHVSNILKAVDNISFTYFNSRDVVRHPIVQKVVDAYDTYDQQTISALNQENDRRNERDS